MKTSINTQLNKWMNLPQNGQGTDAHTLLCFDPQYGFYRIHLPLCQNLDTWGSYSSPLIYTSRPCTKNTKYN